MLEKNDGAKCVDNILLVVFIKLVLLNILNNILIFQDVGLS